MADEPPKRDLREILNNKPKSSGYKSQLEFIDGPEGSLGITTAQGRRKAGVAAPGKDENVPKPQEPPGNDGGSCRAIAGAAVSVAASDTQGRKEFDHSNSKNRQSPRGAGNQVEQSELRENRKDKDQDERRDQKELYNSHEKTTSNDNSGSRDMKNKGNKRSQDEAQGRLDGDGVRRNQGSDEVKQSDSYRNQRDQAGNRPRGRDGRDDLRNDKRESKNRPTAITETREDQQQKQKLMEGTGSSPEANTRSGLDKSGSKRDRVEPSTVDDVDPSIDPKRPKYDHDRQGNGSNQNSRRWNQSNSGRDHDEDRSNDGEFYNRNRERERYDNDGKRRHDDDRSQHERDRGRCDGRGGQKDERKNPEFGSNQNREDSRRFQEKRGHRSTDDRDRDGDRNNRERDAYRGRDRNERDRPGYRNHNNNNYHNQGGLLKGRSSGYGYNDRDDRYRSDRDSRYRDAQPPTGKAGDSDNSKDLWAYVKSLIMNAKSDHIDMQFRARVSDQMDEFKDHFLQGGQTALSNFEMETVPLFRSRGIRSSDFIRKLADAIYKVYHVKGLNFPVSTELLREHEKVEADHGSMTKPPLDITRMVDAHVEEAVEFVVPVVTVDPIEARFEALHSRLISLKAGMEKETDEKLNNAFCLNDIGVLTESIRLSDLLKLNSVWSGTLYVNPQINEAHADGISLAGTLVPSPYYEEMVKEHTYSLFKEGTPKLKVFSTVSFRVLTNVFSRSTVLMLVCPQPIKFTSLPARNPPRKETLEIRLANAEDKHHFERQMYQNRFSIREFRRYVEHLVIREHFAACIWQDDGSPYIDWIYLMPPVDFTLNMFDIPIDRFPFKHVFLAAIAKASRDDPRKLLVKQSPAQHETAAANRKE